MGIALLQVFLMYDSIGGIYNAKVKRGEVVLVGLLVLIVFILLFGSDNSDELFKAVMQIALILIVCALIFGR